MEIERAATQAMERTLKITWDNLLAYAEAYAQSQGKVRREIKAYGVPRGGSCIAALFQPVETPEEADVIVDDLIDSGATAERYAENYPSKPFWSPFDKRRQRELHGKWLVFPWESNEAPAEDNVTRLLEYVGEDPSREGLVDTPKRYLKFWREFLSPPEFEFTTFDGEGTDEMIVQTNIAFHSVCEHHLAPFYGVGHIAYIPDGRIVGLSKLARTLEWYSRRLQNQERITKQVAERLMKELNAKGVAVVLEAEHTCMSMRGVRKPNAKTRTSTLLGYFKDDPMCRNEFLNLIK
jgi:GTP cyclohydrolase I